METSNKTSFHLILAARSFCFGSFLFISKNDSKLVGSSYFESKDPTLDLTPFGIIGNQRDELDIWTTINKNSSMTLQNNTDMTSDACSSFLGTREKLPIWSESVLPVTEWKVEYAAPSVCIWAKRNKVCMSIFHPRIRHETGSFSLVPNNKLHALWCHETVY